MIGKRIKVNDYKFTYGTETIYINVFGAFKEIKSGNKYIIYSYDNKKLYYGSFFIRDELGTIMLSNNINEEIITQFINSILTNKFSNNIEIIDLNNIGSLQIIDEKEIRTNVNIDELDSLTIPKISNTIKEETTKKSFSFTSIGVMLLIILISLFFFINKEVITGKNKYYSCNKEYNHKEIKARVDENIKIVFTSKGKLLSSDLVIDYVFSDPNDYQEFKEKSSFYKYIKEADTYKFDDINNTYRVFSKINIDEDYLLPKEEEELITHYQSKEYNCKIE